MQPTTSTRPSLRIDVWSDFVCPFCVLEEPVLDQVRDEFGDDVEIVWRAYELRPEPVPTLPPDGEYLHDIWSRAVYPMAADRGMPLRLPPVQPRSRLAHEAERHARRHGLGDAMRRALFKAFFEDGRDIGDVDVLLEVGESVGVDRDGLRTALEQGEARAEVQADQRLAFDIGIQGVPAMLVQRVDGEEPAAVLVSGAQPVEALREAIAMLESKSGT